MDGATLPPCGQARFLTAKQNKPAEEKSNFNKTGCYLSAQTGYSQKSFGRFHLIRSPEILSQLNQKKLNPLDWASLRAPVAGRCFIPEDDSLSICVATKSFFTCWSQSLRQRSDGWTICPLVSNCAHTSSCRGKVRELHTHFQGTVREHLAHFQLQSIANLSRNGVSFFWCLDLEAVLQRF